GTGPRASPRIIPRKAIDGSPGLAGNTVHREAGSGTHYTAGLMPRSLPRNMTIRDLRLVGIAHEVQRGLVEVDHYLKTGWPIGRARADQRYDSLGIHLRRAKNQSGRQYLQTMSPHPSPPGKLLPIMPSRRISV